MIIRYDPLTAPDPEGWQALGEDEQIDLVMGYHETGADRPPNPIAHAVLHVMVENQIAIGQAIPVAATLIRLENEGLDRHDALHAIASVLVGGLNEARRSGDNPTADPTLVYYRQLESLTAVGWRQSARSRTGTSPQAGSVHQGMR
jgi:hypothetical protein